MKSHIKILNRLLAVIPDASCETSIVAEVAKTNITYKDIKVLVEQVGDDVYCELFSESLRLTIKTSDVDLCAGELVRHVLRITELSNCSSRSVPTTQTEVDAISEKFWADIAEKNKVMRAIRERKGSDYDWFDSGKPDGCD